MSGPWRIDYAGATENGDRRSGRELRGWPATFREWQRGEEGPDVAARLTHRLTSATLPELAGRFALSHPGSVSDLLRCAERAVAESGRLCGVIEVNELRLRYRLRSGLSPRRAEFIPLLRNGLKSVPRPTRRRAV